MGSACGTDSGAAWPGVWPRSEHSCHPERSGHSCHPERSEHSCHPERSEGPWFLLALICIAIESPACVGHVERIPEPCGEAGTLVIPSEASTPVIPSEARDLGFSLHSS